MAALQRLLAACAALPVGALRATTQPPPPQPAGRERLARGVEACLHLAVCATLMRSPAESVRIDEWACTRGKPPEVPGMRSTIVRRRRRAAQVGQLIGVTAYTPRIVFLAGVMLRSLQMATKLRTMFDPSLGYAAGGTLAASFSKREWLPCILLGWGFGGVYWSLFRVRPPGVDSVPFRWV